ncbi:unnamed protein product [Linum tenue]|uniref:Uncharacterized protein n=1 Tax=Linum tenue TaxID=586396 RepID=A0AAV0JGS0_9ROSI|nr:unnamed protein product [Linum tenue]
MRWGFAGGGSTGGLIKNALVRYFSKERAVNVRKINPKVPFPEAFAISESLYNIIKQNGPLTVPNTWNFAKLFVCIRWNHDLVCSADFVWHFTEIFMEANISGLNSKTHMKIMLKWMRGRKMLKLLCTQVGSNKKFMHCTLPEEPQSNPTPDSDGLSLSTKKPIVRKQKKKRI